MLIVLQHVMAASDTLNTISETLKAADSLLDAEIAKRLPSANI
jgi:hypothetical protein